MPDRQQLIEIVTSAAVGTGTNIAFRLKLGKKITIRNISLEVVLAACVCYMAYLACSAFHLPGEQAKLVYLFAGWFGSRLVAVIEARSPVILDKIGDKLEQQIP